MVNSLKMSVVVKDIEATLAQEFCCYGYQNMTGELKETGLDHQSQKGVQAHERSQSALWCEDTEPQPFKRNFIRFRSLSNLIAHCSICRWISNMFMCMAQAEMRCF